MKLKAFTLFEILLAISLMGLVAAISSPFLSQVIGGNELQGAADIYVQSIRRAQSLARTGENDSDWGVYIQNGSVTVFEGNSYATRDTAQDEIIDISTVLNITGTQEYVFAAVTGEPGAAGSTTITAGSDSFVITVNSKGIVNY